PMARPIVKQRYDGIGDVSESWCYGDPQLPRLVALAMLVPGNVLVHGMPGNGMTALGNGVAAAIGGNLFPIDGRTGIDQSDIAAWRPDDVGGISPLHRLEPASQVARHEAG